MWECTQEESWFPWPRVYGLNGLEPGCNIPNKRNEGVPIYVLSSGPGGDRSSGGKGWELSSDEAGCLSWLVGTNSRNLYLGLGFLLYKMAKPPLLEAAPLESPSVGRQTKASSTLWLILPVNLARPRHPGIWSNTSLDVAVEVFLNMRLMFKSADSPPQCWKQSEKDGFPWGREILPPVCLWPWVATSALPWVSSLPYCVSQFLKLNLSLWIHILLVLFCWKTLINSEEYVVGP